MIKNGIIIPVLILLPNLLIVIYKGEIETSGNKAHIILTVLENLSRFGTVILPIFYKINMDGPFYKLLTLAMILLLVLYYIAWIRLVRFNFEREYFLKRLIIPLPLVFAPTVFLILSSVVLKSIPMLLFSIVFLIFHYLVSRIEL
ncbi:MAG: hypothetical protein PQJ46_01470 [Spirochaetales bacterium]|nr:hypothetical protein [Spirochaetales bacterium]